MHPRKLRSCAEPRRAAARCGEAPLVFNTIILTMSAVSSMNLGSLLSYVDLPSNDVGGLDVCHTLPYLLVGRYRRVQVAGRIYPEIAALAYYYTYW